MNGFLPPGPHMRFSFLRNTKVLPHRNDNKRSHASATQVETADTEMQPSEKLEIINNNVYKSPQNKLVRWDAKIEAPFLYTRACKMKCCQVGGLLILCSKETHSCYCLPWLLLLSSWTYNSSNLKGRIRNALCTEYVRICVTQLAVSSPKLWSVKQGKTLQNQWTALLYHIKQRRKGTHQVLS